MNTALEERTTTAGVSRHENGSVRNCLVMRRPESDAELMEMLAFRRRTCMDSRLSPLLKCGSAEIDLDCFDPYAHHFGLYVMSGNEPELIGYLRGIAEDAGPHFESIYRIAKNSGAEHLLTRKKTPIPSLGYLPRRNRLALQAFYQAVVDLEGATIQESSRFCIDERYRNSGIAFIFVEASMACYSYWLDYRYNYVTITTSQRKFYVSRGFRPVPGTIDAFVPTAGMDGSCLYFTQEDVHDRCRDRIERYADAFCRHGYLEVRR